MPSQSCAITGREPSDREREKLRPVQVHQAVFQARKILQRNGCAIAGKQIRQAVDREIMMRAGNEM